VRVRSYERVEPISPPMQVFAVSTKYLLTRFDTATREHPSLGPLSHRPIKCRLPLAVFLDQFDQHVPNATPFDNRPDLQLSPRGTGAISNQVRNGVVWLAAHVRDKRSVVELLAQRQLHLDYSFGTQPNHTSGLAHRHSGPVVDLASWGSLTRGRSCYGDKWTGGLTNAQSSQRGPAQLRDHVGLQPAWRRGFLPRGGRVESTVPEPVPTPS
jgi:hypothetical protein